MMRHAKYVPETAMYQKCLSKKLFVFLTRLVRDHLHYEFTSRLSHLFLSTII